MKCAVYEGSKAEVESYVNKFLEHNSILKLSSSTEVDNEGKIVHSIVVVGRAN
jgi:hypothetical protein